jgi:hypothetical protein
MIWVMISMMTRRRNEPVLWADPLCPEHASSI